MRSAHSEFPLHASARLYIGERGIPDARSSFAADPPSGCKLRAAGRARRILLPLLAVASFVAGCDRGPSDAPQAPLVDFEAATIIVETEADTFTLRGEIAQTESQRAYGLMDRDSLPQDAGMIFVYDEVQPAESGFWMFRTRIPLDIAYLDEDGRILVILEMEPCTSPAPQWCDTYPPGVPYHATLEVNRGWFTEHGVGLGDRVVLQSE